MSNVAGEIYFIAEEPSLTTPTVRVKIGLVRESRKNRDSQDRLLDHQTGNPRSLVLVEVIKTARVSHVENSLHQRYASRRGIGEWFELTKVELDSAIAECSDLAAQQSAHLHVIQQAEALKHATRSDVVVAASEEAIEWHRSLQVAKESESIFVKLKGQYKERVEMAHEAGINIDRYAAVTQSRQRLDSWFLEHHKIAYEACKRPSKSERFKDKGTDVDPALEPDHRELADEFRAKIAESNPEAGFDEVHKLYLETRRPSSIWKEEKNLATAHLKVLCGLNRGIEEIGEWKTTVSRRFSAEIAEDKYPNLVQAYATIAGFGASSIRLRDGEETGD